MLLLIAYTVNMLILLPVALATTNSKKWATLVVQSKFPVDSPFRIWQCVGMIVGVYGIGDLITAVDSRTHWPIVLVGLLGNVFGN